MLFPVYAGVHSSMYELPSSVHSHVTTKGTKELDSHRYTVVVVVGADARVLKDTAVIVALGAQVRGNALPRAQCLGERK